MLSKEKIKLGEVLIQQKIMTPLLVERVLLISSSTHRRFGQTLEDLGLVTGKEIAQALAIQYGCKIVSDIARFAIPRETIRLVPMETAFEHRVFPLQVKDGSLALAMADPTSDDIVATLESDLNLKVVPFITTTRDIMQAIGKFYLGEDGQPRTNSILVVGTDSRERGTVAEPLTREGYHVLEAVDAEDGYQLALIHLPRLVITAKDMPGSDGFAFFTSLHGASETRGVPVILLSQRASAEEEAAAFQRGFFDYVPMPVRDITLLARVGRALAAGKAYVPHRNEMINLELG